MRSADITRSLPGLLCVALQIANTARAASNDWWSLKPLSCPPLPSFTNSESRVANPIDAFIAARLAANSLVLAPEADRRTLIRRVCFDLIGLPPTPEEVEAFVNEPSSDAYEGLIERLLASPRYGERWARHWMDVAHFAETHG